MFIEEEIRINTVLLFILGYIVGGLLMTSSRRRVGYRVKRLRRDIVKVTAILDRNRGRWMTVGDIRDEMTFKIEDYRIEGALDNICGCGSQYVVFSSSGDTYYRSL